MGCRTGGTCIQDMRDAGLEGCRKGGMKKWRDKGRTDAKQEKCQTGGMPER